MIEERRVAACVEACEGLSTELLEAGLVQALIGALVSSEQGREILAKVVVGVRRIKEREEM